MANSEHLAKILETIESYNNFRRPRTGAVAKIPMDARAWRKWRMANTETAPDLSGARLVGTDFSGAVLNRANLTNAMMGFTIFGDNDLSGAKGLETVRHVASSVVGIDTIYRSKGNIPESFLRGAGVPEEFIIYMKSLTANPFEFYSCFISYSTKDQAFADRLYADLQNKGVRCWFAPHVQAVSGLGSLFPG